MDCGHVHCLLVAKRSGEVILERFYDRLSDADKGELRAALHNASAAVVQHAPEDAEFVDGYRDACIVFTPVTDTVIYLVGSGEYDELMLSSILRVIKEALRITLKKAPSEALMHEKYTKVCVTIDEIINEGILDTTDPEAIRRSLKLKGLDAS